MERAFVVGIDSMVDFDKVDNICMKTGGSSLEGSHRATRMSCVIVLGVRDTIRYFGRHVYILL